MKGLTLRLSVITSGSKAGHGAPGQGGQVLTAGGGRVCFAFSLTLPDPSPRDQPWASGGGGSGYWAWLPEPQGDFRVLFYTLSLKSGRRKPQLPGTGDDWALLKGSEQGAGEACEESFRFPTCKK